MTYTLEYEDSGGYEKRQRAIWADDGFQDWGYYINNKTKTRREFKSTRTRRERTKELRNPTRTNKGRTKGN